MKTRFLLWCGVSALAAMSPAAVLDDFVDGAFNSGTLVPSTSYYVQTTSAPQAWSGARTHVVYGQNPNAGTSRVAVDAGVCSARMEGGIVSGFTEIVYGRPYVDFQSDLRPATHINITIESTSQPLTVLVGLRGPASSTLSSFAVGSREIAATAVPVTVSIGLGGGSGPDYDHLFGQAHQIFVDFSNPGSPAGNSLMDVRVSRIQSVPEPLSMATLGIGLALLALRRSRRQA